MNETSDSYDEDEINELVAEFAEAMAEPGLNIDTERRTEIMDLDHESQETKDFAFFVHMLIDAAEVSTQLAADKGRNHLPLNDQGHAAVRESLAEIGVDLSDPVQARAMAAGLMTPMFAAERLMPALVKYMTEVLRSVDWHNVLPQDLYGAACHAAATGVSEIISGTMTESAIAMLPGLESTGLPKPPFDPDRESHPSVIDGRHESVHVSNCPTGCARCSIDWMFQ